MTQAARTDHRYTIDEYLRSEYDADQRHEYYDGVIVAMAGGSPQHSLIISNVIRELGNRLKGGKCRVYDSNLRVRVPRSRLYVYPDATVVCGPTEHDTDDVKRQTVTNPKLIVEVLSDSTEHLDHGPKFRHYLECPSLEEYVLVAQDSVHVQSYFRQGDGTWLFSPVMEMGGTSKLRSLGIELPLADVYAGVEFPPPVEPVDPRGGQR
jgi:Uma2 family endonuclease